MSLKILSSAALVLLLPLSFLYAEGTHKANSGVQAKVDALFAGLKEDPPVSAEDLTDGLLLLGPSAVPCLLKHLNRNTDKATADIVSDVLRELKDENTVPQLAELLRSEPKSTSLGAARALGLIGTPEAVAVLGEAVMTTMSDNYDLFRACREAVISILRRGDVAGGSFSTLAELASDAKPEGKARLIKCLGASESKEAVRFLIDFLRDEETSVKAVAISALGRLKVGSPMVCSRVRKYLRGRDIKLKKQAVTTLGTLKDWESVSYLIDLLEDDNSSVARSAHWALRNITGLRFPLSHQRWIAWWNRESEKLENRMDPLIDKLHKGTVSQRVYAIRELSGIALGREDVVGAVLEFTRDEEAQIRKEACTALGTMRSTEAVPYLIDRLDDSDETVRAAAHRALREITGENLPPERVAWKEWSKER